MTEPTFDVVPAPRQSVDPADAFTDALLARLAAGITRRTPDPLGGLRVSDEHAAQLVGELGGDGESPTGRPDDIDVLREALHHRLSPGHPLHRLGSVGRLTRTEVEVLAVLAGVATDARRGRLVGWLNDDVTLRTPTVSSLTALFGGDRAAALAAGPDGGLSRACLLQTSDAASCWSQTPLALHPDVLWWLWAQGRAAPCLPPGACFVPLAGSGRHSLVVVAGPDRTRRLEAVGRSLAADAVLSAPAPDEESGWEHLVRAATLAGTGIALELPDHLTPSGAERIDRATHLAWALCSPDELPVGELPRRHWHAPDVAPPAATPAELAEVLDDPGAVGDQLTADQLQAVQTLLRGVDGRVDTAVRRLAAGGIGRLAERIVPRRGWDDLVLPARQAEQVRHLSTRARHRDLVYNGWGFAPDPSRGVVAMFSGPSGTGKTLAAEVVAGELGLDVYRVDLSQLVDKYVGETEKNLAEAFDAAAASPVVLFFDEADAVLGKRSAVQDSHDRYANLQVAYLLQRLERHDGVVILASNLPGNLDQAFSRRLHVHVEFALPGPVERRAIWRRAIPPQAPAEGPDLDRLADRFEMSGGLIRNAAQTAAFLAAEAGSGLTMELLELAVRRELIKDGRLVREEDFGPA